MMLCLPDVLTRDELVKIQSALAGGEFVDGRESVGFLGRRVKNNLQLPRESSATLSLGPIIEAALRRHILFDWAVWPKRINGIRFSRYDTGMEYGAHIDNALM